MQKSDDSKKSEDSKKTSYPGAQRSKLRTDGVTELKYDRYSATSFTNFEQDMKMVAGQEYGDLFGYVIQSRYPPENDPTPTSVELQKEDELSELDQKIAAIELEVPEDQRTQAQKDMLLSLQAERAAIELQYSQLSAERIRLMNLALEKKYDAAVKEAAIKKAKYKDDMPKLYWLIRKNLSDTSETKIKDFIFISVSSLQPNRCVERYNIARF